MSMIKRTTPPTFKERCKGKVWRAIDAMIKGLEEQDKREDYKVDMRTFGRSTSKTCFGCAATCTLQHLTHIKLRPGDLLGDIDDRAVKLKTEWTDLSAFEDAINDFRKGWPGELFSYMGVEQPYSIEYNKLSFNLKELDNQYWRRRLGPYRDLLKYLKGLDI